MAATIFASSSPSLSLTEMSTPAYNALSLVGQRIYLGNLLENWEIGKLYLCQTSSNHCQFFSHIVKFDFVIRKYFLWNCCDWDYQTCLRVLEKLDGNWDFDAPTSFGISDLTFKRFHCFCVNLRFRYWRCGFSVSWSQGANRLKYLAGQVKQDSCVSD